MQFEEDHDLCSKAAVLEMLRQELEKKEPDIPWVISFFEDLRDRLLVILPSNDPRHAKILFCFDTLRLRTIIRERVSIGKHLADLIDVVFSIFITLTGATHHQSQVDAQKNHFLSQIESGKACSEVISRFFETANDAIDKILIHSTQTKNASSGDF